MKMYLFNTITTVKQKDNKKWSMDLDMIKDIYIKETDIKKALAEYVNRVNENSMIEISKTAIKNKTPMFVDDEDNNPIQVGYIITGRTSFDAGHEYIDKYIDLWVEILAVDVPIFES